MISSKLIVDTLSENGVQFFAGVPDSLLREFCAYLTKEISPENHVITANEGGAVAMAIGHHLVSQAIPAIYLQNSGLGNAINPLLSLASNEVYGIPMILFVGWRGHDNEKDEPQHVHQGRIMPEMIRSMGFPSLELAKDAGTVKRQINEALNFAKEQASPFFVFVRKGTFEEAVGLPEVSDLKVSREAAIIAAIETISDMDLVVATTGMISREVFEYRKEKDTGHHRDFLTVGGMGHASQIALGIANARPDRQVFCFDGDGAALMHMGGMALVGQSSCSNLVHIIFNNGVHASVGGQKTVGFEIDFCKIAEGCGYGSTAKVNAIDKLVEALELQNNSDSPRFVEVHVRPENKEGIGRPDQPPSQNKFDFIDFVSRR